MWKTGPLQTYLRVQLVCMKVQAHKSLEPHRNKIRTFCLWKIKVCFDLFTNIGNYRNILEFQISSRRKRDALVVKVKVLRKVFSKQFSCIKYRRKHLWTVKWRRYSRFTLLRTLLGICQMSLEPTFWEVMDSCFISICKFRSFKNSFVLITSLLNFRFGASKKVTSVNYGSSTSRWKPWRWVRFDHIYMIRDIYNNSNLNPLTNFTSNSRSTELKISSPRTSLKSLKWSRRPSQSARE